VVEDAALVSGVYLNFGGHIPAGLGLDDQDCTRDELEEFEGSSSGLGGSGISFA